MTPDEVLAVVRARAAQLIGADEAVLPVEAAFAEDLHVDSLALVEYVMDLEDELGIELPETEMAGVGTVGQLAALAAAKVAEKA